ncbi:MAG: peptidylprolyl isomerase [Planctomycetota bacterium]|nr:peptidylprolyl isomerase [Planctomycetota bacterium]
MTNMTTFVRHALGCALTLSSMCAVLATTTAMVSGQKGAEVKLSARSEFASATGVAELVLSVYATEDTKIPMVLLSGLRIKTMIDGKAGPVLRESASGTVKFTKGTRFVRPLSIDMTRVLPGFSKSALARVTFEWVGVKGASTFVQVAPDFKTVAVDQFDLAKTQVALLTNHGELVLKFHPDKAPNTVKNFLKLAKSGFYDTTGFHRVIPGFMIQGGCPNSKPGADGVAGTGSPGYTIKAEFNDTRHVKGVISMARSSAPDSAGCQFFIVHAPSGHLDGKYTAFGELVSGLATLDKIAGVPCNGSKPVEPVRIRKMIIKPVFKK